MSENQRPNDFLTIDEVLSELRLKSRVTVYRLIHRGQLAEPYRIGNRSRWKRSDVERCKFARQGLRRPRWRGRLGGGKGLAG